MPSSVLKEDLVLSLARAEQISDASKNSECTRKKLLQALSTAAHFSSHAGTTDLVPDMPNGLKMAANVSEEVAQAPELPALPAFFAGLCKLKEGITWTCADIVREVLLSHPQR